MADRSIVLSLCDYTGVWCAPYKEAGYSVIQVDTKHGGDARLWPTSPSDNARYSREMADISDYVGLVRIVLAAPVCTAFANCGARHKRTDPELIEALGLVDACMRIATVLGCDYAIENPIGKLRRWLGAPAMSFNPCDYAGHADNPMAEAYTKRTQLFGHFNTALPLAPVEPVDGSKLWRNYGGKSERTKAARSITPQGFARAFHMANK